MLSMQKFSSNVIEKCMDRASEEVIVKYVRELADRDAMRRLLQVPLLHFCLGDLVSVEGGGITPPLSNVSFWLCNVLHLVL